MIEPRHVWVPKATRSLGADCVAFWKAAGGQLFDWQAFVIEGMLGLDEEDHWTSVEDGLDVARQNGKGVILQAIEAFVAFELGRKCGYELVMHTAHEFATSQDHQLRLEAFIQEAPHLHSQVKDKGGYRHANGQESINLKDGTQIRFKARTKGGARGFSGDLLVWDEAMVIPEVVVGAQMPTVRASQAIHGRKTIYAGSAVDQEVHEHGITFARLRERGVAKAPRVSWYEWSAPFEHPQEMAPEDFENRDYFHAANPSMSEGLIEEQTMVDEIASMASRTSAVELFGVGDWPRTDRENSIIPIAAWDALEEQTSRLQVDAGWCLSFDVSPERRTAIAFSGRNQNGDYHTEIQEARPGTGWAIDWIAKAVERGKPGDVVCDGVGPAASLVVPLAERGVKVRTLTTSEHGQACGQLVDMVADQTLRHLGSAELRDAVRGAGQRTMGDAWAWSRRSSAVDISPLVAATLGLHGFATLEQIAEPMVAYG